MAEGTRGEASLGAGFESADFGLDAASVDGLAIVLVIGSFFVTPVVLVDLMMMMLPSF